MAQINYADREIYCKIAYYGPGLSGKTTKLEFVHDDARPENRGALTSFATDGDRTLFFDFMPLDLGDVAGMRTRIQLYTVPGQVHYDTTRKLVLQGVDGVAFVADSNPERLAANEESLQNLFDNLKALGIRSNLPLVMQWNKRDVVNPLPIEVLEEKLNPRQLPSFEAVAADGSGVFATLKTLIGLVLEELSHTMAPVAAVAPSTTRADDRLPTPPPMPPPEPPPVAATVANAPVPKRAVPSMPATRAKPAPRRPQVRVRTQTPPSTPVQARRAKQVRPAQPTPPPRVVSPFTAQTPKPGVSSHPLIMLCVALILAFGGLVFYFVN